MADSILKLESSEISLIQNRLTIAGLALAALLFSGSFSLSLFTSFRVEGEDYRATFLHTEVSLALGIAASLLAIGCFLISQQLENPAPWYRARLWWFAVGQILLYLTLAQALSSSLTEVVYGIGIRSQPLALLIGISVLPVWLILFFFGPIWFIRRIAITRPRTEAVTIAALYIVVTLGMLAAMAESYRLQDADPSTTFLESFLEQLYQPVTWRGSW